MTKRPLSSQASGPLKGQLQVPGDKSISHRALMFSLLAKGRSTINGLLEGEDVLATAAAMRALGGQVEKHADGHWSVDGVGLGALKQPLQVLDMGNSGTAARLLIGLLSTHPIAVTLTGDASLRSRPMNRVLKPLAATGAHFAPQEGGLLPLSMRGADTALKLEHRLAVASAQVKSALLLAALNLPGTSTIYDPFQTRDHTENMLRHCGADIATRPFETGTEIILQGRPTLSPSTINVPADPSSAAFATVGAVIVVGSDIALPNICMNPTRTGLFEALRLMGADIAQGNSRIEGGEPVADLRVRASNLKGIDLPQEIVPRMVDEFPILAIAAANAIGTSRFRGLEELRVKESDRLAAIHAGLINIGVTAHIEGDDLIIQGCGANGVPGSDGYSAVVTHYDHRIAMSFLIAGLASQSPITVDDGSAIATSYPNFSEQMLGLGACIRS